jgi:hypothetical protein
MSHPNFIILYVSNPTTSAVFYERLLVQCCILFGT